MAEIVLRGALGLIPRAEGGRHLLVQEDNGDVYRIPMGESLFDQTAAAFAMTVEELEEHATDQREQQSAKEKIVLPGQGAPTDAAVNGHPG